MTAFNNIVLFVRSTKIKYGEELINFMKNIHKEVEEAKKRRDLDNQVEESLNFFLSFLIIPKQMEEIQTVFLDFLSLQNSVLEERERDAKEKALAEALAKAEVEAAQKKKERLISFFGSEEAYKQGLEDEQEYQDYLDELKEEEDEESYYSDGY